MSKGDHLRVCFGWYQHHGIDIGDGSVIHFGRGLHDLANAHVEIVSLEEFSKGRPVEVCKTKAKFATDEIIARAFRKLGDRDYDLFQNNCEHFVTWCRDGVGSSLQIEASETVARQTAAAVAKPILRCLVVKRIANSTASRIAIKLSTRTTGAALCGDATQTAAELIAIAAGKQQDTSRRIGWGIGAATSAAVGTAMGGPLGGAATLGLWFAGQVLAHHTVEGGKRTFNRVVTAT